MTPPNHRLYYDHNGNTPDFKGRAEREQQEEEEEEKKKQNEVPAKLIPHRWDNGPCQYGRPGELPYEDEEIEEMEAKKRTIRREFLEDLAEAQAEQRLKRLPKKGQQLARNIFPENSNNNNNNNIKQEASTPVRKAKIMRKDSPVHTPSPTISPNPTTVTTTNPTPWQQSPLAPPTPETRTTFPLLCPYCLQLPCDNQDDLDDTHRRVGMYFPNRIYNKPNDFPGNFQRRKTFRTIYKEIVTAKGREVYAQFIPMCVKASAQHQFPTQSSMNT